MPMQKFISQKQLYSSIKQVSEAVQNGDVFIVLKYSKPAYKIVPLDDETTARDGKKYTKQDIHNFVFRSANKEQNLATDFKKHLY